MRATHQWLFRLTGLKRRYSLPSLLLPHLPHTPLILLRLLLLTLHRTLAPLPTDMSRGLLIVFPKSQCITLQTENFSHPVPFVCKVDTCVCFLPCSHHYWFGELSHYFCNGHMSVFIPCLLNISTNLNYNNFIASVSSFPGIYFLIESVWFNRYWNNSGRIWNVSSMDPTFCNLIQRCDF